MLKKTTHYLISAKGFTLIEMMVVVGIIGILAMIAIPNFNRYQAKTRQSEAKLALSAVFTAEKSFFTEYSAYFSSFNAVGYTPEGQKRNYNVGFTDNTTNIPNPATIGYLGDTDIGLRPSSWRNFSPISEQANQLGSWFQVSAHTPLVACIL